MVHFSGIEEDFETWRNMGVEGWSYNNIQTTMSKLLISERGEKYFTKTNNSCSNNYKSVFSLAVDNICQRKLHEKAHKIYHPKLHITTLSPEMSTLAAAFTEGGEVMKRLGYDKVSFSSAYSTIKEGHRWSTFDGFLKPYLAQSNINMLLKSVVSKVLFSEKRRAIGVEIIKPTNQTVHVYSKNEIILCSGSINSPQILLLSGIGPHYQLQKFGIPLIKDLPVGLGLHDHLNIPLYVSIKNPISITMDKILSFSQLLHYVMFRKGHLASSGIVGVGSVSSNIGIVLFGLGSVNEDLLRRVANYKLDTFRSLFPFSKNSSQEGFVLLVSCLQPVSRGFVALQSSDPMQPPLIDPQYLSQKQDVVCMSDGVKFAARMMKTQPFQDLGARLHLPHLNECKHSTPHFEDDAYLECLVRTAAITGYHPAGTCKMGRTSDPTTVVDSFLRVHGTSGLRVVDASVMPTPISGHPNSIITTLAERAASFILNSTESDQL
ncbi:Neither inactivation nor afterpotential protein G [Gryllus bimaculatus]|nr:Neither inactivation nor afterpotential protein G [Gryllus bimaculatus]